MQMYRVWAAVDYNSIPQARLQQVHVASVARQAVKQQTSIIPKHACLMSALPELVLSRCMEQGTNWWTAVDTQCSSFTLMQTFPQYSDQPS